MPERRYQSQTSTHYAEGPYAPEPETGKGGIWILAVIALAMLGLGGPMLAIAIVLLLLYMGYRFARWVFALDARAAPSGGGGGGGPPPLTATATSGDGGLFIFFVIWLMITMVLLYFGFPIKLAAGISTASTFVIWLIRRIRS